MAANGKTHNGRVVRICVELPLDLHVRVKALCGPGRLYRSIGQLLLRATEKTVREASKTGRQLPASAEHPLAPRNESEWQWTYGLIRYLRAGRGAYPALKQLLAELLRIGK